MLSQFTNYFLLFILVSFYVAIVIRFYIYLLDDDDSNILYKLYAFLWSLIVAPFACFYGIMDLIADSYEDNEEDNEEEDND